MNGLTIRHAETEAELAACFPVMVLLRPHLSSAEEFVTRVARQHAAGYRLLAAWRDGAPLALAGYRFEENLIRGKFVYVDDLVTAAEARRNGIGARLLDAVSGLAATPAAHTSCSIPRSTTSSPTASTTGKGCWRAPCASASPSFRNETGAMTRVLQILVSPRPQAWSRRVAGRIVDRIAALRSDVRVVQRDLAADPPPHPDRDLYEAILSPTPDDDHRFALSECYIGELERADVVVIGTPMNNFCVPSTLKAWIDHIVRIRRTFQSTPEGKIGLLRDRPVIVASAHGGYVSSPPMQPDFLTPYLQAIFETIGIHSLEFVRLEGMARGPEAVARALDGADGWIERRLPELIGGR